MERVKREIFHHVGGEENCQWSNAQIEGTVHAALMEPASSHTPIAFSINVT